MILKRNTWAVQFLLPPGTSDEEVIRIVLEDFKKKCEILLDEGIYNLLCTYEVFTNRYMSEWYMEDGYEEIYNEIPEYTSLPRDMFGRGEFPIISIYRRYNLSTGNLIVAYKISR